MAGRDRPRPHLHPAASGPSGGWLINANLLATLLVLLGCCALDLRQTAAVWNVRHAREVGGRGAAIDLCYLNQARPLRTSAVD